MPKLHIYLATLSAAIISPSLLIADPPAGVPPDGLVAKVDALQTSVDDLDAKVDTLQTSVDGLDAKADTLQASIDNLDSEVDALADSVDLILGSMMVPFRTTIGGGLCDSSDVPNTSNPEIHISGSLEDATFVVNSILIQTTTFTEEDRIFGLNSVRINGAFFQTSGERLFNTYSNTAPGAGTVPPGFDLMGLRLRESQNGGDQHEGGVFPTQIVATSDGDSSPDIDIKLFCRSDITDWSVQRISVAGMKQVDDEISVSFIPGD